MKSLSVKIQMKASEQYIPVVLLYYAARGGSNDMKSVHEILQCDHSNKSYWEVLSCGDVY